MYLRGLANINPASCPEGTYPASYQMAIPMDGPPGMPRQQQYQTFYECKPIQGYVKAAPPPQITITVPTQVQTDVSPQISPQFIQQDEPRDSPIVASTSQSTEASAFQEYLAQQEERDAQRDADRKSVV